MTQGIGSSAGRFIRKYSIRAKLILFFALIAIIPMAITTFTGLQINTSRTEKSLEQSNLRALNSAMDALTEYANRTSNLAHLLANTAETRQQFGVDTLREFLDANKDVWFPGAVEVFDHRRQLVAYNFSRQGFSAGHIPTPRQDDLIARTLDLEMHSDYFVSEHGFAIKSSAPIVDMDTLSALGAVVVTYPLGSLLIQTIRERVQAEVTIQWHPDGNVVSTLRGDNGEGIGRIWDSAVRRFTGLGAEPVSQQEWIGRKRYATAYAPLVNRKGETVAILSTATDFASIEESRHATLQILFICSSIAFFLAICIGLVTSLSITRPIYRLLYSIRRISEGHLEERAYLERRDEIGELARAFNEMATELERNHSDLLEASRIKENYTRQLEITVSQRTDELSQRNAALKQEIEERKRVEEKLRESEEKYRNVVERANDGIAIVQDEIVKYVNPQAANLLGYRVEEIRAAPFIQFFTPDDASQAMDRYLRRMTGKETQSRYETRLLRKDGRRIEAEINTGTIFFENRPAILAFIRDIGERRQLEKERIKVSKLESISFLAGGIAHDFNNILTVILGNVSLAKMYIPHEDRARKCLDESEKAALRAKDLTQRLLTFSKGGAPIKQKSPISDLLRETVAFNLSGSNIKCDYAIQDGLWPAECDPEQISQVISNLISNSKEAMPEGGILEVGAENIVISEQQNVSLRPGAYVRIFVKDRGIGIPKDNLEKIFDPYFSTKQLGTQKGMGLGLTIVHSIIRKHGGHIHVESDAGIGTTFHIYLSASAGEDSEGKQQTRRPNEGKGRILLMDDEEVILEVTGEMLMLLGYEVECARDGMEAVESYRRSQREGRPFDAVIVDLTIPGGMGGEEAAKRLREVDHEVKLIVSSGYCNDPIVADFLEHGFDGVLCKPYRLQGLGKTLQEIIRARSR